MKNSMVKMIKKVTAAFLAAVTVMGAVVTSTPAIVRADDFKGIKLEELPDHPTSDMDINVIKNAYRVGNKLGNDVESGKVVYIQSLALGGVECLYVPHGTDIVVVYRTYTNKNMFGQTVHNVSCKSLIDGETFDLCLCDIEATLFELNKAPNLDGDGIDVGSNGLQNSLQQVAGCFSWVKNLWPF